MRRFRRECEPLAEHIARRPSLQLMAPMAAWEPGLPARPRAPRVAAEDVLDGRATLLLQPDWSPQVTSRCVAFFGLQVGPDAQTCATLRARRLEECAHTAAVLNTPASHGDRELLEYVWAWPKHHGFACALQPLPSPQWWLAGLLRRGWHARYFKPVCNPRHHPAGCWRNGEGADLGHRWSGAHCFRMQA